MNSKRGERGDRIREGGREGGERRERERDGRERGERGERDKEQVIKGERGVSQIWTRPIYLIFDKTDPQKMFELLSASI